MNRIKIGITVGDINGIGMEIILKTLSDERILDLFTPIIYGSTKLIAYHKNIVDLPELKHIVIRDASEAKPGVVNVVNCWQDNINIALGTLSADGGHFAALSLEKATQDALDGHIRSIVTAPINKKAMQMANFGFPGHTEYFADRCKSKDYLMMMVAESLRVALVTTHVPLSKVASNIHKDAVLRKINMMNDSLRRDFGIDAPKIAVLGLNPHAGDEGALGTEEQQHITPAINQARKNGLLVFGPYPADGFFGNASYDKYDGVLAMYHDQGLVAFKTLSFHGGVNFTAGLPFVRTSPDHGTGFDIAGQNLAVEDSFRTAIFTAIDIVRQRSLFIEDTANPLQKQTVDDDDMRSNDPDGVVR